MRKQTSSGKNEPRTIVSALKVAAIVAAIVAAAAAIVLIWPEWWKTLPRAFQRDATDRFLRVAHVVYVGGTMGSLAGAIVLGVSFKKWKGKRARRPFLKIGALCGSILLSAIALEAGSAAWLRWRSVLSTGLVARMPKRLERGDEKTIRLTVIGESSARGFPYQNRLSIGEIVAWKLQEALPKRKVEVQVLAEAGATLGDMCGKLAELKHRPDALIIYSGHNEFQARFSWGRSVRKDSGRGFLAMSASPFCRLILEARERNAIDAPPERSEVRRLVDWPVCSDWEYEEVLTNFRRSLETIVVDCEAQGILPILIIPPSNDAGFEPSRSVLPETDSIESRREVERLFKIARASEGEGEPSKSLELYRRLSKRWPMFAEAHYRRARLLERVGRLEEANREYILARDCDALPLRCPSPFQDIYREVAAKHDCILIDGPKELRERSPTGVLDYQMFHDEHHPTLLGHSGLAEAVLRGLRARRAFGWTSGELPKVVAGDCAKRFKIDAATWISVCEQSRIVHEFLALYRYDPLERLAWAARFQRGRRDLEAGKAVEEIEVPGLGGECPKLGR